MALYAPTLKRLVLPEFDMSHMNRASCIRMAQAAEGYGAFLVRDDAHYDSGHHNRLLDALEVFGDLPEATQRRYIRPHYQAGWMPAEVEIAREEAAWIARLDRKHRPYDHDGPNAYGRWFHRPNILAFDGTSDPELLPQNITVEEIPNWDTIMENWGGGMMMTIIEVARRLAIGWGLPEETIIEMLRGGHNIVGTTITDLRKFGTLGRVHAHLHYDLNAITAHDGSRFRVLIIWTKSGIPMLVVMKPGYRLMQIGRMMEHVTGGRALRGRHQTATLPETIKDMERAVREGRPLIRGSATFFAAFNPGLTLEPLAPFRDADSVRLYPPLPCMEMIREELAAINMKTQEWAT